MNLIQRLNAVLILHIRDELRISYSAGIVRYNLNVEDAEIIKNMTHEEVIAIADSTLEPVFTIRPIMRELQSHASGSEFDLLLSVIRQNEPVIS